jgi:hypothetical protein
VQSIVVESEKPRKIRDLSARWRPERLREDVQPGHIRRSLLVRAHAASLPGRIGSSAIAMNDAEPDAWRKTGGRWTANGFRQDGRATIDQAIGRTTICRRARCRRMASFAAVEAEPLGGLGMDGSASSRCAPVALLGSVRPSANGYRPQRAPVFSPSTRCSGFVEDVQFFGAAIPVFLDICKLQPHKPPRDTPPHRGAGYLQG